SLEHFLGALVRKPYAVTHAAVVRQLPEPYQTLRRRLMEHDPSGYREMVQILLLHREFAPEAVREAIQEALAAGIYLADGIRQLLLNRFDLRKEVHAGPTRGPAVPVASHQASSCSAAWNRNWLRGIAGGWRHGCEPPSFRSSRRCKSLNSTRYHNCPRPRCCSWRRPIS